MGWAVWGWVVYYGLMLMSSSQQTSWSRERAKWRFLLLKTRNLGRFTMIQSSKEQQDWQTSMCMYSSNLCASVTGQKQVMWPNPECGKSSMGTYNKGHYVAFCKQFFTIYIISSFKIYLKWGLLFFHKGPGWLCGHMISVGTTQLC